MHTDHRRNTPLTALAYLFILIGRSFIFRMAMVAVLAWIMIYPLKVVEYIVFDLTSETLKKDSKPILAAPQTIIGPVLSLPYEHHIVSIDSVTRDGVTSAISKDEYFSHTLVLLPEDLNLLLNLKTEPDNSNPVTSYRSKTEITGQFDLTPLYQRCGKNCQILWDQATLSMALSEPGNLSAIQAKLAGKDLTVRPSSQLDAPLQHGVHANIPVIKITNARASFELPFTMKGSKAIQFAPLGDTSDILVVSDWPTPHFSGKLPPSSSEQMLSGFKAHWKTNRWQRGYPTFWQYDKNQTKPYINQNLIGITFEKENIQQQRLQNLIDMAWYALALLFAVLLTFERSEPPRPHPVHYLLLGCTFCLFFLIVHFVQTLIEPFLLAYLYSAASIIALIALYVTTVWRSFWRGLLITLFLCVLFAALYTLIDYQIYQFYAFCLTMMLAIVLMLLFTLTLKPAYSLLPPMEKESSNETT